MHSSGRVLLGVSEWDRPEWVGGFYPEDMPAEWRLTFYNTQYSCVWLPYVRWGNASIEDVRHWLDDSHESFRFLLEEPPALDDRARAVLAVLGDRVAKCCGSDDPELVWFEAGVDLKALSATIRDKSQGGAVYLISRDGHLATMEQVETLLGLLGLQGS